MKHIKLFWLCLLALLTATEVHAQYDTENFTVTKCDDGSNLNAHFITILNGVKSAGLVEGLPMLCVTDNENITSIFQIPSMKRICEMKEKDGYFHQVNRDGYLTAKSSLLTTQTRPNFYNFKNEKLWTCKQNILLSDRKNNVVVCETDAKGYGLVAYDMTTGNELWRNTITHRKHFPWYNFHINNRDSAVYYLMADSLWRINIQTGTTKSVRFESGRKTGMKLNIMQIIFPSAEWRKEAASSLSVSSEYATGTNSNWLVKGDSIFVADAEQVYCFDHDLNMLWATALPEGTGCKSHLSLDGDMLRLMGFGVAFKQGKTVKNGEAFLAAYDRKTGRQQGFTVIKTDHKLIGGAYVNGRAYWQDNKSFYYTNEGDTTVNRIDWKPKTKRYPNPNYPNRVICDTVWTLKGGELHPVCTDSRQLVVELYGKDVYLVHDDGSSEMLSADEVYFHDVNRLYSTNGSYYPERDEQPRHYAVTAHDSHRVIKSFPLVGSVWMPHKDQLLIKLKLGVGIVNLNE